MKLDDLVYLETDDSCALCGIRGIALLGIHHMDENRANNVYENLIVLCHNCHTRFHQGGGVSAGQIRDRKRHLIHKTITTYGLSAMKSSSRNNYGVVAMPFLLYHVVDLGYMKKEETQMGYGEQDDATARFSITDRGRKLLADWFQE